MNTIGISVISNRTHITLLAEDILYLSLSGRKTVIHVTGNRIYETYTPIDELEKNLGSAFIRVDRCCLVSAKAIHDVTNTINLINGESLDYARRRKREIVEQLDIKDSTLRFHNKNIYEKLGVSSLKQLQQFVAILNSGSGSAPDESAPQKGR